MKKYMNLVNKTLIHTSLLLLLILGLTTSCVDSEPQNIDTFTDEMMGTYLESRANDFSEFARLLDTTEVMGLVNAYGKYTLFAPDNTAMKEFYASKGKNSLSQFTLDTLKKIAYDHLIKGYVVKTNEFSDGLMPYLTMSDRFVSTSSKSRNDSLIFVINDLSEISNKDIEVSNGIIHVIKRVLSPSALTLVQAIAKDEKFTLFYDALIKTGLATKLIKTFDETYDPKDYNYIDVTFIQGGGSKDELPVSKKYGYTALMESDATFANLYNIHNLDDLKAYAASHVYNEDPNDANVSDIQDPRNSLHKFIAYHLIDKKLTYSKFIDDYDTEHMIKSFDMYEYIETMSPNTLIEIKKDRASVETNLINKSIGTDEVVRIVSTYKDKDATNGVYHEIDKMLIYDQRVAGELATKDYEWMLLRFFLS
jgi:uncharacterized surface protein with fasciclin (FAS1) repeats